MKTLFLLFTITAFAFSSIINTTPVRAQKTRNLIGGIIGVGAGALLLNQLNKNNKRIRRQTNPAKRAEPRMSRQQVFSLQQRLNELGYNVGGADGKIGRNTRRGIRKYQAGIGARVTGYLSSQQFGGLGLGSAVETTIRGIDCNKAASDDEFAICGNRTLRSLDGQLNSIYAQAVASGNTSVLRFEQRVWLQTRSNCGGDVQCLTGVYQQRIANLSQTANNGINFSGIQNSEPVDKKLTKSQMRVMQRALNKLGYNAGRINGRTNRRTGRAVSRFLRDRSFDPYSTSPQLALKMAIGESGLKSPTIKNVVMNRIPRGSRSNKNELEKDGELSIFSANEQPATSEFDDDLLLKGEPPTPVAKKIVAEDYKLKLSGPGDSLNLNFARRAIFSLPKILDNNNTVASWLKELYPRADSDGGNPDILRKFYKGTKFERVEAIRKFREILKGEAIDGEFRFTAYLIAKVQTGNYREGIGFPLTVNEEGYSSDRKSELTSYSLYVRHLGIDSLMYFKNTPTLETLPILDAKDAGEVAKIIESSTYGNLYVKLFITVKKVGVSFVTDGFDRTSILTDASLDGMELELSPSRNSNFKAPKTIFTWSLDDKKGRINNPTTVGTPWNQFASWAKIPKVNKHLVIRNDDSGGSRNSGWRKLLDLSQLIVRPSLFDNDIAALFFGNLVLSKRDRVYISRGKNLFSDNNYSRTSNSGRSNFDEFEYSDVMEVYRSRYRSKIFSRTPKYPIPVVHITPAKLAKYDFKKGGFPLSISKIFSEGRSQLKSIALDSDKGGWKLELFNTGVRVLPKFLKIEKGRARELLGVLENLRPRYKNRTIYLAVYSVLDTPKPFPIVEGYYKGKAGLSYQFKPSRLGVYADAALKLLITELPISDGWSKNLESAQSSNNRVPILGPEMVNLLRVRSNPDLLKDESFLFSALKARILIGRNKKNYPSYMDFYLPETISNGKEKPTQTDLAKFRAFYLAAAKNVNVKTVRWPFGINGGRSNGMATIRLADTLNNSWTEDPLFEINKDPRIVELAKIEFPDSVGYMQIATLAGVKAVVAFRQNPAWFELKFKVNEFGSAGGRFEGLVDFQIHRTVVKEVDGVGSVYLFELEPIQVVYVGDDKRRIVRKIEKSKNTDSNIDGGSNIDIDGIQIGMKLSRAMEIVKKSPIGYSVLQRIRSKDSALNTGVQYLQVRKGWVVDQIAIFVRRDDPTRRVIAVGRTKRFSEEDAKTPYIVKSLVKKYGKADAQDNNYAGWAGAVYQAWGGTPTSKAIIRTEGINYECILYPLRNYKTAEFENSDGVYGIDINTYELKEKCGTVLSSFISDGEMYQLLLDTGKVIAAKKAGPGNFGSFELEPKKIIQDDVLDVGKLQLALDTLGYQVGRKSSNLNTKIVKAMEKFLNDRGFLPKIIKPRIVFKMAVDEAGLN